MIEKLDQGGNIGGRKVLDEEEEQRIQYRRRMRGSATFFMVISVIGSLSIAVLAMAKEGEFGPDMLLGTLIVMGGMFMAALGTWNGSRSAAIALCAIVCASPLISLFINISMGPGAWARSIFYAGLALYMTVNTFRYRTASKLLNLPIGGIDLFRWGGSLATWACVAFLGFGSLVLSFGTTTAVLKESEITEEQIAWLSEQNFLIGEERPLYLYLDGLFGMDQGGSLLTDEYAGGWWKEDGEVSSVWIKLGQICEVKQLVEGSFIEDAVYSIHSPGEERAVQLWLSIEDNVHEQFIARMKSINSRRMRPEIRKFCDENRVLDWVEVAAMNGISQDIVAPDRVTEEQRNWLREKEFLLDSETILKFYAYGRYGIEEGGVLFTDAYFGGWFESGDELGSNWFKLGEICKTDQLLEASSDAYVVYKIWDAEGGWLDMYLPAHDSQAANLIKEVLALNERNVTDASRDACANATLENVAD